jgi:hypothetical protein
MSLITNLCTPSYVYLVISMIALLIMYFQNVGNADMYCLGTYSCNVYSTSLVFLVKLVYILFWTWLLNLICQKGSTTLSWFLVFFPFLLMFLGIALTMYTTMNNNSWYYISFVPFLSHLISSIKSFLYYILYLIYSWLLYPFVSAINKIFNIKNKLYLK